MVEPSKELQIVFDKAIRDAKNLRHEYVTLEHLVYAILCEEKFSNLLTAYGANIEYIKSNIEQYLRNDLENIKIDTKKFKPKKTSTVERVLNRAFTQTLFAGRTTIELTDLILSVLHEKKSISVYYLEKGGVDKSSFGEFLDDEQLIGAEEDDELSSEAKRALRAFTSNLNDQVKKGKVDPIIGRTDELEKLALALGRRAKNNVLMVGDPGVGKTAIAEGLAFKIVLQGLTKQGKTIMFIDEAHMINGAGAGGQGNSNDLANMLKPALTKGDLKVVASTTWEEYRKYFEKDRALMRRFQRVTIDEPTPEVTKDILNGIKKYYEDYHATTITEEAIESAVKLSVKYQSDKKLPDKAIDLIDVACSRFNLKEVEGDKIVSDSNIEFELSKMLNLPEEQVAERETE